MCQPIVRTSANTPLHVNREEGLHREYNLLVCALVDVRRDANAPEWTEQLSVDDDIKSSRIRRGRQFQRSDVLSIIRKQHVAFQFAP